MNSDFVIVQYLNSYEDFVDSFHKKCYGNEELHKQKAVKRIVRDEKRHREFPGVERESGRHGGRWPRSRAPTACCKGIGCDGCSRYRTRVSKMGKLSLFFRT